MELLENISEYYDELFPVSVEQEFFFENEMKSFEKPVKFLSVNCGTGLYEHKLAMNGVCMFAIESIHNLISVANRRRRTQLMTLNFFEMSTFEMVRFLAKGFFNIISILNDRLIFMHDDAILEKFFFDCKQLLAENGKIILSIPNFDKFDFKNNYTEKYSISNRESIRTKLFTDISIDKNGKHVLSQDLETGNGTIVPISTDVLINVVTKEKIEKIAKKIGFSKIDFYSDFQKSELSKNSDKLIAVIS